MIPVGVAPRPRAGVPLGSVQFDHHLVAGVRDVYWSADQGLPDSLGQPMSALDVDQVATLQRTHDAVGDISQERAQQLAGRMPPASGQLGENIIRRCDPLEGGLGQQGDEPVFVDLGR